MAPDMWRDSFLSQRRAILPRLRRVACQQVVNAIGTQRPTPSTGKQRFGIFFALLPNPSFEDRDCGSGQGCTTFLASFPPATYICAVAQRDILVPQRGHLGQSQTGLNGGDQKSMGIASQPLCSITRRPPPLDFWPRQKAP